MKFGADNVAMNSMGLLAPETSEVNRSSCQELRIKEVLSSPLIPCFRCGVCCTRYQVRLSLVEARRIADQLIFWAALAQGTSRYRIPLVTEHVETNLWLVETILGAKTEAGKDLTIEIEGVGHGRKGYSPRCKV